MSLQFDSRQRAMLAEMGIRLFDPDLLAASPREAVPTPPVAAVAAGVDNSPRTSPTASAPRTHQPMTRQPVAEPAAARAGIELLEWDALAQAVASCRACALCDGRRNTVFGVGDRKPDWLLIGEAPGENEDMQGEPFLGQPGKLLDNMLKSLGLSRHDKVYITNVLKCRPPGNRNPEPREISQCEPFLRRQVELLQPKIILAMGPFAVQSLLGSNEPIGKLRGRVHEYLGVPVVVTYHPAYLLRNLPDKAKAWADLCLALDVMRRQPAAAPAAGR